MTSSVFFKTVGKDFKPFNFRAILHQQTSLISPNFRPSDFSYQRFSYSSSARVSPKSSYTLWAVGSLFGGSAIICGLHNNQPADCKWPVGWGDQISSTNQKTAQPTTTIGQESNNEKLLLKDMSVSNIDKSACSRDLPKNSSDNTSNPHGDSDRNHPSWKIGESQRISKKFEQTAIFSGNSNLRLAENIADCLGTKLGRVRLTHFADGEVSLQFLDSLRGKDVYIIQGTSPPVNENLMELLLMISTCRRASAKKITAVIPYYGYARQDRKLSSRVPISAADVARMIEAMGVDRVISVDLHSGQIQGFFGPRVPVDNLEAQIIGLDYFDCKKLDKPVIVSPDAGGVYRARKFQERLRSKGKYDAGIAMLIKQRARPNEIERMDIVGNVEGCDVIIVDDMIDTAGTLCEAAAQLRQHGAKRVFAFATHGLFSGPALKRIEESVLEEVVVSDTIQLSPEALRSNRITQLSIGAVIADAVRRIHQKESLEQLFSTTAE